jgi:hypothetical protein
MNKKSSLILEIIWLTTGILCIAAGTKMALGNGGSKVLVLFSMALISFLFGWQHHRQRKKNNI